MVGVMIGGNGIISAFFVVNVSILNPLINHFLMFITIPTLSFTM